MLSPGHADHLLYLRHAAEGRTPIDIMRLAERQPAVPISMPPLRKLPSLAPSPESAFERSGLKRYGRFHDIDRHSAEAYTCVIVGYRRHDIIR